MTRVTKYTSSARLYDVISAEWPVYRAGRVRAIGMCDLQDGDHVIDIGCGTGLNFDLVEAAIGPRGLITGIDSSQQMLHQAQRRVDARGWTNVRLVHSDATALASATLPGRRIDAAIATYSISLMRDWPSAVRAMIELAGPQGTVAMVDMQEPSGPARVWTPLARLACKLGGSDISAHPWTLLEELVTDVRFAEVRGGHIQVRVAHLSNGR